MMKLPVRKKWHKQAKLFFNDITGKYIIDEKHRCVFYGTIENLNRFYVATDQIDAEGGTYRTESGQVKRHPACQLAKESWSGFLQGLKALGLFEFKTMGRPPGG